MWLPWFLNTLKNPLYLPGYCVLSLLIRLSEYGWNVRVSIVCDVLLTRPVSLDIPVSCV
jgi:hypothetical protein